MQTNNQGSIGKNKDLPGIRKEEGIVQGLSIWGKKPSPL